MLRIAYALAIVTLIGGTVVMAHGVNMDARQARGAALLLVAGVQQ